MITYLFKLRCISIVRPKLYSKSINCNRIISVMYFLCVFALLATILLGCFGSDIDLKIIERVNAAKTTWKASENHITSFTEEQKQALVRSNVDLRNVQKKKLQHFHLNKLRIPETFDARKKWKDCFSLRTIKDQGLCSGCWAISSASVMSDRLCISSKYKIKVNISAEEIISCCSECGGCDGGNVEKAWLYFIREGVVTGGDYKSNEGCKPFSIVSCGNNCSGSEATTPKCIKHHCTNTHYHHKFKKDLHFGSELYAIQNNVKAVQAEIFLHGPVVASYGVYQDFYYYKSGIYKYVTGAYKGGHSVRVLGWGTENGTDYWLVANSWGPQWGENGLFRIIRGTNEVYFETNIITGSMKSK